MFCVCKLGADGDTRLRSVNTGPYVGMYTGLAPGFAIRERAINSVGRR